LAQERPREFKLESLKPPGNDDSEYVCEQNGNVKCPASSEQVCVIIQTFARVPCFDEPQKCGHIWGTARRKPVNFRGRGD
jgi:hypothetical protein